MKKLTQLAVLPVVVLAVVATVSLLREKPHHPHIRQTTTCLREGMSLGWGLDEYRKTHPTYPAKLEDMVPDNMSRIPVCPASGKPFHYQSNGKSYVYYCDGARDAFEHGGMERYPVHRPVDNVNKVEDFSGPPPTL